METNELVIRHLAKELRNHLSHAEQLLWTEVRSNRMYGYTFVRQKPISNYLVDFFCAELQLIIEIDNRSFERKDCPLYDHRRQIELEGMGYHVLRFHDKQVKMDMATVRAEIELYIQEFQDHASIVMEEVAGYELQLAV